MDELSKKPLDGPWEGYRKDLDGFSFGGVGAREELKLIVEKGEQHRAGVKGDASSGGEHRGEHVQATAAGTP